MEDHNKTYGASTPLRSREKCSSSSIFAGFTITMYEFGATIPTLWDATKEFIKAHPEYVAKNNAMGYMSDDNGNNYNLCHCAYRPRMFRPVRCLIGVGFTVWSNFEIANMDFWRGEAYTKYFEFLDSKGGFYYEVCRHPR